MAPLRQSFHKRDSREFLYINKDLIKQFHYFEVYREDPSGFNMPNAPICACFGSLRRLEPGTTITIACL